MPKDAGKLTLPPDLTADQVALFDDWSDNGSVVEVGGFGSELWDPQESPVIVGFRSGTRYEVGPHKSTMYELDTREGLRSVWGTRVLDNKMEHVPAGALVRIEQLGEHQGAENTYMDYSVKYKIVPGHALAPLAPPSPAGGDRPPF
jgi:hypothetical protein